MTKGYFGSKTDPKIKDSFSTPQFVFNYYDHIYNFTLDVAANDVNHKCRKYYTIEDNALDKPWSGFNWCNPPYSDITPWVDKAIEETFLGNTTAMLIPADTSASWFRKAFENAHCDLIEGRISFINATTGKPQSGNNKGSVVFIFTPEPYFRCVKIIKRKDMQNADLNRTS